MPATSKKASHCKQYLILLKLLWHLEFRSQSSAAVVAAANTNSTCKAVAVTKIDLNLYIFVFGVVFFVIK